MNNLFVSLGNTYYPLKFLQGHLRGTSLEADEVSQLIETTQEQGGNVITLFGFDLASRETKEQKFSESLEHFTDLTGVNLEKVSLYMDHGDGCIIHPNFNFKPKKEDTMRMLVVDPIIDKRVSPPEKLTLFLLWERQYSII